MYPTLFKIGFLEIHTYGVFVAIGFFIGFQVLLGYAKKSRIPEAAVESLTFLVLLISIIGARLFYVLISFREFTGNPVDILKIWQGGLVFSGGFLAGAGTVIIFSIKRKIPVWKMVDIFAPALAVGHSLGRIGCFFAGCCCGQPTGSFLGVVFPEQSLVPYELCGVKLVPLQLISAVLLFILFLILKFLWSRKRFDGQIFLIYAVLYSAGRFFIEFLRGDFRGNLIFGITPTQIVAVLVFVTGAVLLGYFSVKNRTTRLT